MLNNGCLCCTVRDDLVNALNKLWERRDSIDHIIIETTGRCYCWQARKYVVATFASVAGGEGRGGAQQQAASQLWERLDSTHHH